MKRRAVALGAVAAVAAATGAGTAWWRSRRPEAEDPAEAPDLWSLTFQSVDGGTLRMADWRGRPLLLNFWATWCGPCVVEMPLLDRFATDRAAAGWRVLALAIDKMEPVQKFAKARSLRLPMALGGAVGLDLSRSLGNRAGGLPFSVVFDSSGDPVARSLGPVSEALLADWVGQTR